MKRQEKNGATSLVAAMTSPDDGEDLYITIMGDKRYSYLIGAIDRAIRHLTSEEYNGTDIEIITK